MDLPSRAKWYEYSRARDAMFKATDTRIAPWHIVRSDDKKRARLNIIAHLLKLIPHKKIHRPESQASRSIAEARLRRRSLAGPAQVRAGDLLSGIVGPFSPTAHRLAAATLAAAVERVGRARRRKARATPPELAAAGRGADRRGGRAAVRRDGDARLLQPPDRLDARTRPGTAPERARQRLPSSVLDDLAARGITEPVDAACRSMAAVLVQVGSRTVFALTSPDIDELSGETLDEVGRSDRRPSAAGARRGEGGATHLPRSFVPLALALLALAVTLSLLWAIARAHRGVIGQTGRCRRADRLRKLESPISTRCAARA